MGVGEGEEEEEGEGEWVSCRVVELQYPALIFFYCFPLICEWT